jgi:8-oxo-dGTP pyrophosphatase MutT (NUDIX family)
MASLPSGLPEFPPHGKRTWRRARYTHSAGGVAYRRVPAGGEVQIALIATHGGACWQLPKGSRKRAESPLQTALREVREEVGLYTEHEQFLKTIDYWYWDTYRKEVPELVHKAVDFFLLRVVGGTLSDACTEVDAVGWFSLAEAQAVLTFAGELEVVQLASRRLQSPV